MSVMIPKDLQKNMLEVSELVPYIGNAKEHPDWQVEDIVMSIDAFGFNDPIAVWKDVAGHWVITEGHGRLLAAKALHMEKVPVIRLDHLDDEGRRAYTLVHNQLTMNTGFDMQVLNAELDAIEGFDMGEFGFDVVSVDLDSMSYEPSEDIAQEMLEKVDGDLEFTEYVDEESNYVVLKFKTEKDWLNAQSVLGLEQVRGFSTARENGNKVFTGMGRVVDGVDAFERIGMAYQEMS